MRPITLFEALCDGARSPETMAEAMERAGCLTDAAHAMPGDTLDRIARGIEAFQEMCRMAPDLPGATPPGPGQEVWRRLVDAGYIDPDISGWLMSTRFDTPEGEDFHRPCPECGREVLVWLADCPYCGLHP